MATYSEKIEEKKTLEKNVKVGNSSTFNARNMYFFPENSSGNIKKLNNMVLKTTKNKIFFFDLETYAICFCFCS